MEKKYHYFGQLGIGAQKIVYRPILEIVIEHNKKSIRATAIVDSGTEISLIESSIAHFLEIDLTKCKKVKLSGITGEAVGYASDISIQVEGFKEILSIPVIFTDELKTGILLGQIGFFESFIITFDKAHNEFLLERNRV